MNLESTDNLVVPPGLMALHSELDPFAELRAQALRVMEASSPSEGAAQLEPLIRALHGSNSEIQVSLELLGRLGSRASGAVTALTGLLKHPAESIRARSAQVLGRIGAPARAAAPALFEALSDSSRFVRSEISQALRILGCG